MTSSIWNPTGSGLKPSSGKRESTKILGVVMESQETLYEKHEDIVKFDDAEESPKAPMQFNDGLQRQETPDTPLFKVDSFGLEVGRSDSVNVKQKFEYFGM